MPGQKEMGGGHFSLSLKYGIDPNDLKFEVWRHHRRRRKFFQTGPRTETLTGAPREGDILAAGANSAARRAFANSRRVRTRRARANSPRTRTRSPRKRARANSPRAHLIFLYSPRAPRAIAALCARGDRRAARAAHDEFLRAPREWNSVCATILC